MSISAQTTARADAQPQDDARAVLELVASIPIDEMCSGRHVLASCGDDHPICGWQSVVLTVGHVRAARRALGRS